MTKIIDPELGEIELITEDMPKKERDRINKVVQERIDEARGRD